jgi:hypothetical protein
MLRNNDSEHILVLINLKGISIVDYSLTLKKKALPNGTFTLQSLLDSTSASPLSVSGGTFTEYKPRSELPPYSAYIFQLK